MSCCVESKPVSASDSQKREAPESQRNCSKKVKRPMVSLQHEVEGEQHGFKLRYQKQDVLGFAVYVDDRVREELHDKAMTVIQEDLKEILRILPENVVSRLFAYPICFWVNLDSGAGKKGCCCHCIDLPHEYMACKAHSVELFNLEDFLAQGHVQPAVLLHEVSHWVHHDRINEEQQRDQCDRWRQSTGHVSLSAEEGKDVSDFRIGIDAESNMISYRMSNFRNTCLNGSFTLEQPNLEYGMTGMTQSSCKPRLVKATDTSHAQIANQKVICWCTDRFSTKNPKCPDRWHLEVDGKVLAYRNGTDFGMTVAGWKEWLDGSWLPSTGLAESLPLDESAQSALVEGFSEEVLNGEYVAKISLDLWYHCANSEPSSSVKRRTWMKQSTGNRREKEVVLRYTNMSSDVLETAAAPFDRWHLETEGSCCAYLCNPDPTVGDWRERVITPTDQVISNAYASSLPLYTQSCERVGKYACEPHYAATNHKEYFAECSEAYFSTRRFRNDYFPYINAELRGYDPVAYAMCESIWGPRTEEDIEARYLEEFWPHCKIEGSAVDLVRTSEETQNFLARVCEAAHARREQVLGHFTC